jgi:hypothetical protein
MVSTVLFICNTPLEWGGMEEEEDDDPAGWVVDGEQTPRWAAEGVDPPRPWCRKPIPVRYRGSYKATKRGTTRSHIWCAVVLEDCLCDTPYAAA